MLKQEPKKLIQKRLIMCEASKKAIKELKKAVAEKLKLTQQLGRITTLLMKPIGDEEFKTELADIKHEIRKS